MNTIIYLDACPVCDPGIPPACPPIGPVHRTAEGDVTAHQCTVCETAWSTLWQDGWVGHRSLAPVVSREAA